MTSGDRRKISYGGRILAGQATRRARYAELAEDVSIDVERPPSQLFKEALGVALCTTERKIVRIAHMNNIVRVLAHLMGSNATNPWKDFNIEEVLLAVRCLLIDDEKAIRAASIRVLRYLIQTGADLQVALKLHFDTFIIRCIDLVLDNQVEREHSFRLFGRLLAVYAESNIDVVSKNSLFPVSFMRALVALCSEGQKMALNASTDSLCQAALGLMCEMSVRAPDLVLCCASTGWLVKALLSNTQPFLIDILVAVLVSWLDIPSRRKRSDVQIMVQELIAPLSDDTYCLYTPEKPNEPPIESRPDCLMEASKLAVISVLRCWPGLLTFLADNNMDKHSKSSGNAFSPLKVIVDSIGVIDSERIRETNLELCCELLQLPYARERLPDWQQTLDFKCTGGDYQSSYYKEALSLLPSLSDNRLNLIGSLRSVVLFALVQAGLPQALVRLILVNPDSNLALKATLLLGDLMNTGANELPVAWRSQLLSLPHVIQAFCDTSDGEHNQRSLFATLQGSAHSRAFALVTAKNAHILLGRLDRLESLDAAEGTLETNSLQLEMLLRRHGYERIRNRTHSSLVLPDGGVPSAEKMHDCMRESRVNTPYTNPIGGWDWALLDLCLCHLEKLAAVNWSLLQRHLDDSVCLKFLIQVLSFYQPQSRQFSKLQTDWRSYSRTGCRLMRVLGQARQDSTLAKVLISFLAEIHSLLLPERMHVGMLSPRSLSSTSCADYFAFIGELTSTEGGYRLLERTGLMQRFLDLIGPETEEVYVKLIISGLDCARPGLCRTILQKALTCTNEKSRRYATRQLHVLGLLRAAGFENWGIEMLTVQVADGGSRVAAKAVQVLHDLLCYETYREAFVRLKSPVLPLLGDAGVLLQSYFLASEKFVKNDSSGFTFARTELAKWKEEFNLKYVQIIEETLRNDLCNLRRDNQGTFKRFSSNRLIPRARWLPPHALGQLAHHTTGCVMLSEDDCVQSLFDTVQLGGVDTEEECKTMKAALWALGHIGSNAEGLTTVLPLETVPIMVKITEECPVLSVRGVAFWALNLIGQTSEGAGRLDEVGWESNTFMSNKQDEPVVDGHRRSRTDTIRSGLERQVTLSEVLVRCCQPEQIEPETKAPFALQLPNEDQKPRSKSLGAEERKHISTDTSEDETKLRSFSVHQRFYVGLPTRSTSTVERPTLDPRSPSIDKNDPKARKHSLTSMTSGIGSFGEENHLDALPSLSDVGSPRAMESESTMHAHFIPPKSLIRRRKRFLSLDDSETEHPSSQLRSKLGLQAVALVPRCQPLLLSDMRLPRRPSPSRILSEVESKGLEVWQMIEQDIALRMLTPNDSPPDCQHTIYDHFVSAYRSAWPELSDATPGAAPQVPRNPHRSRVVLPADFRLIVWNVMGNERESSALQITLGNNFGFFDSAASRQPPALANRLLSVSSSYKSVEVSGVMQHQPELCIHCAPRGTVQFAVAEESGIEDGSFSEPARSRAGTHVSQASSNYSNDDTECSTEDSGAPKQTYGREEVRKEVLHLICLLDVRKRHAEQSLLKLRQEQSYWFSSICLYSDVCSLMARYQFQLSSRRFVQEMFQEVNFSELWDEPQRLFGGRDMRAKLETVPSEDVTDYFGFERTVTIENQDVPSDDSVGQDN